MIGKANIIIDNAPSHSNIVEKGSVHASKCHFTGSRSAGDTEKKLQPQTSLKTHQHNGRRVKYCWNVKTSQHEKYNLLDFKT